MSPLHRALIPSVAAVTCLLSGAAHAGPVVTEFCFEYALDYTDGATGDLLTGSSTAARGAWVEFYDETLGNVAWDGYVSHDSADAGCIRLDSSMPVLLDDQHEYTVSVYRKALLFNNNEVIVNTASGGSFISIVEQDLQPQADRVYSYANGDTWTRLPATDSVLIMAAAKFALQRRWAGLSNETFLFRTAPCSGTGSGSCYDYTNERIWIADPDRKFLIVGVMGYAVSHFANGHDKPLFNGTADMDDCIPGSPYRVNTKEYGSRNAVQAFAMFYPAVVFNNDGSDADCEYQVTYHVDWNADGFTAGEPDEDETFSCSASPAPNQSPPIPDFAYFDFMQGCGGIIDNRGTAYDWLKHLWDYRTDSGYGGYSTADIYDLWDDADPDTWIAAGDLGGGTLNYPYDRLYQAEGGNPFGGWNALGAGRHGIQH